MLHLSFAEPQLQAEGFPLQVLARRFWHEPAVVAAIMPPEHHHTATAADLCVTRDVQGSANFGTVAMAATSCKQCPST